MPERGDERRQAAILALVRAHARSRSAVTAVVQARVRASWRRLGNPYDDRAVAAFTAEVGPVVAAGRTRTANLTETYLRRVLAQLGVEAGRAHVTVADLPRGIPLVQEYSRPAETYRYEVSRGTPAQEALSKAGHRAESLAETDLSLSMRDAAQQTLAPVEAITGWRRIIHPELSKSGSCGLCVAAATRVYHRQDLLPLHGECACTVLPIIGMHGGHKDPGLTINDVDLGLLYEQVGSTAAAKLKRARYVVHAHGELGLVLREAGHEFRGPGDVAAA